VSQFVFVHGAWHDHTCWTTVLASLKKEGYSGKAFDLPGHAKEEQDHLHRICLATYKDAVIRAIEQEPEPVHLVGHSMSGIILLGVASIIPEKIASLHFIASFIPEPGFSIFDEIKKFGNPPLSPYLTATPEENRFAITKSSQVGKILYSGIASESQRMEKVQRLMHQPLSPMAASVRWRVDQLHKINKIQVIICEQDQCILPDHQRKMALHLPHFETDPIECDHSPELSNPELLKEVLLKRI
jgi:pimeloyl-ACP methyl ester carboxylesterase